MKLSFVQRVKLRYFPSIQLREEIEGLKFEKAILSDQVKDLQSALKICEGMRSNMQKELQISLGRYEELGKVYDSRIEDLKRVTDFLAIRSSSDQVFNTRPITVMPEPEPAPTKLMGSQYRQELEREGIRSYEEAMTELKKMYDESLESATE